MILSGFKRININMNRFPGNGDICSFSVYRDVMKLVSLSYGNCPNDIALAGVCEDGATDCIERVSWC